MQYLAPCKQYSISECQRWATHVGSSQLSHSLSMKCSHTSAIQQIDRNYILPDIDLGANTAYYCHQFQLSTSILTSQRLPDCSFVKHQFYWGAANCSFTSILQHAAQCRQCQSAMLVIFPLDSIQYFALCNQWTAINELTSPQKANTSLSQSLWTFANYKLCIDTCLMPCSP